MFNYSTAAGNTSQYDNFKLDFTPSSSPTITAGSATAAAFTTTYGTASDAQGFTISGSNLTADLVATAPTGFEVANGLGAYGPTATFTQSSGSASGTLNIRLKANAAVTGSYNSQNISLASTGATSVNIATASSGNTVSAKGLTITGVTANSKNFDGNPTATLTGTAALVGVVSGDEANVTLGGTVVATFADALVGAAKPVTVTGYMISGTAAGNYTLSQPTGLTAAINAVVAGAPTITTITPGNTQLTVAFTAPTFDGGTPITNYEYSTDNGSTFTAVSPVSTTSPIIITGLTNLTTYQVQIRAVNLVGQGAASGMTQGTPEAASSPVISTSVATLAAPLTTTYGAASTATTFTVSGEVLSGDLTVTAPTGLEVSNDGSTYGDVVTLTATAQTVTNATVHVRLKANAAVTGSYNGAIIAVSGGGATTQNVLTAASGNVVTAKGLTITGLTAVAKEYDGLLTASVTGTPVYTGLENGESFSVSETITWSYATKTVGISKPLTASGSFAPPSTNYTITQPTLSADITTKALTVTGATAVTRAYNGTPAATITGATLVGIVSPDDVTVSGGGNFADANVGTSIAVTAALTLGGADAGNYTITQPTSLSADITKASQTITFAALSSKTVSSGTFNLTATASSGLAVTYTSSNLAVATISGNIVTIVGIGSTTITASQAGDSNYDPATDVTQSQSVTVDPTVLTAGDVAVIGYNASGTPDSISLVFLKTLNAGTTFYVNDNEVSTVGGTSFADTGEAEATFTVSAGQTIAAGTVVILPWGNQVVTDSRFTWTGHTGGGLSVTSGNFDDGIYIYTGTSATALTPTAFIYYAKGGSTAANSGNIPAGLSLGTTAINPAAAASRYKITGATYFGTTSQLQTAIGNTSTNWESTAPGLATDWTFTIAQNQTITFNALASKTYGDATFELAATASSGLAVSYVSSDPTVASISGTTVTILKAGTVNITASQAGDSTYGAATPVVQSLTIGQKAISVTANSASKTYGADDPTFTYGADALVGSDSFTGSLNRATGESVLGGPYAITQGTLTAGANYAITFTGANLTVDARALTVTASNVIKTFGDTLTGGAGSSAFTSNGLQFGETIGTVTVAYGTGAAAGDLANTYVGQVTISAATGGTFGSSNYNITYAPGNIIVSSTPTLAPSTSTLAPLTTIYGSASAAGTFTLSGSALSGNLTVAAPAGFEVSIDATTYGASQIFDSANVSTTTISVRLAATTGAGTYSGDVTISGTGFSNVLVATTASTVATKALMIGGLTATGKIYNSLTTAMVSGTPTYDGMVNGDSFTVTDTITWSYGDKNVGINKPLTASGSYAAPSANYTVTQPTLSATITAKTLTVSGVTATKVYDGTTVATITATIDNAESGDLVSVAGTGTFADVVLGDGKNVGTGKSVAGTLTLSGTDAGNYTLTQPASITGDITAKALTVTANNVSKSAGVPLTAGAGFTGFTSLGLASGEFLNSFTVAYGSAAGATGDGATEGVYAGQVTISSPVGSVAFLASNYDISFVTGSITVGTAISAGDVAVIGYNVSGAPDSFAILVLKDLREGTTFFVNDNEVASGTPTQFTDLLETEATFSVKSGQTIAAGTVVILPWGSSPSFSDPRFDWTGFSSGGLGATSGNANEEIYIYTAGSLADVTPTAFIFGAKLGVSTSAVPTGLTLGTTFIATSATGAASRYKTSGATYSASQSALLTEIGNTAANWEASAPVAAGDWLFTVAASNAAPTAVTLTPSSASLAENTAVSSNLKVADIVITDDGQGTNVLSLTGADAASFEIVGTELFLKAGTTLNFEGQSSYSVTVEVNDSTVGTTTPDASAVFTLNLTNLDEVAPTINSGAIATAINENSGAGQVVYTAASTDSGDIATGSTVYSLKAATGDFAAFTIDGSTGAVTLTGNPDFETKPSYAFTVVATDAAGNSSEQAVTLAINNLDEVAPTINSGAIATAINENSGAGQVVYTVTSTDSGDIATGSTVYSLKAATGDFAAFTINGSTGAVTLTGNPDFETKPSYAFTVVATDAAGNSSEQAVTLAITNLDEVTPVITSGATAAPIAENSGASQVVYTATATDFGDISGGVTFSLKAGSDAALSIVGSTGVVTLTINPDFETKPSYAFTVVATDAAGNSSEQALTLTVTDENEAPSFGAVSYTFSLPENSIAGTAVGTASATDPDASASLVYSLTGTGASNFVISSTGAITVATGAVLDFETTPSFSLTAQVSDGTNSVTVPVTINLTDVVEVTNNAPVYADKSFSIYTKAAADTVIGTATATDSNMGQTLTYTIQSGNTGDRYAIHPTTGVITKVGATALAAGDTVLIIRATDNGSPELFDDATVTISAKAAGTAPVFSLNGSPVVGAKTSTTLNEFSSGSLTANGTVVGTLSVADADEAAGTAFTVTMEDKSGAFDFNATTGVITVKTAALLNFEKTPKFVLKFTVTDNGLTGLPVKKVTSKLELTVNLDDKNDTPTIAFKPSKTNTAIGANVNVAVLDTKTTAPFASVTIGDADKLKTTPDVLSVSVTLDNAAKGAFTPASLTKSGFVAAGGGVYTFSGTAKAATSAITKLLFAPTPNRVAVGSSETTTFTLSVNDGVAPIVTNNTTTVVSTSVNNLATVTGAQVGQTTDDKTATLPFANMTIGDVDVIETVGTSSGTGQQLAVTVTLDKAEKGAFTSASLTASGFVLGTAGTYTFAGTAAQATAAIRQLNFLPTENRVAPGKTEAAKFTVSVLDPVATKPTVNKVTSVIVTSINDNATIGGVAGTTLNTSDKTPVTPFTTFSIGDVDAKAKVTVTVTLDNPANGTLLGAFKAVKTSPGVYTFAGTPAAATAALQALSFKPTENQVAPGTTATTQFAISVTDNIGLTPTTTTNAGPIVVATSVNDAPTINGAVAGLKVDDTKTVLPFTKVAITDVDAQPVSVTVALNAAINGAFTATSLTASGFTAGSTAGSYTFNGTAALATAAIRKLVFQPTLNLAATKGGLITTTFTITVDDAIALAISNSTTTVISKRIAA